ncbi:MAG: hypothetical protein CW346_13855 [Bacillaceae bacterium]|nr:hypothetical protein [Bacillaceae bacterium]
MSQEHSLPGMDPLCARFFLHKFLDFIGPGRTKSFRKKIKGIGRLPPRTPSIRYFPASNIVEKNLGIG